MRTLKVVFGVLLVVAVATAAQGTASTVVVGSARQVGSVRVEPMAADAVPQHMNVQGFLTDASGNPVNGSRSIRFDIYRGSSIWNETQSVDVDAGLFSAILGSVTPIPYEVFEPGTTCELELTVEGEALSPRIEIASVGFAFRSVKSDTAAYALASAGGDNAWVRSGSDSVLYTVNRLGLAKGGAGNALHGTGRMTHVNFGIACTTGTSGQNYNYATVSGGYANSASAGYTVVAGGEHGRATGSYSTIGGGSDNVASGTYSLVSGGNDNVASANYAVVSGGNDNIAGGLYSGVLGGAYDTVMGPYSTAFGRSSYIYAADTAIVLFDSLTNGVVRINRDGRQNGGAFHTQPIYVGTSTSNGNRANLTAGGVWTDGALNFRSFKREAIDAEQMMAKVKSLAVTRLTVDGSGEVHIAPTADDFYAAFKCGTARVDNTVEGSGGGIAALDVAGVSLAAVQELLRQLEAQQARIADLEARLAQLEQK